MQHYLYASVTLSYSVMPSPRKRIGFLPGVEIQEIIDRICSEEKLSQSKVTGLLVEEALEMRGVYKPKLGKKQFVETLTKVIFSEDYESNNKNSKSIDEKDKYQYKDFKSEKVGKEVSFTQSDYELFMDFLEYKRFKFMMMRAKEEDAL